MDRKRKHKELGAAKTDKSRQRRLDNKAKREAIHKIDPDMKVKVIDQVTYDDLGTEIMVENGKIKTVEPEMIIPLPNMEQARQMGEEIIEVFNAETEEVEGVEVDDVSKFQTLVNKWRSK